MKAQRGHSQGRFHRSSRRLQLHSNPQYYPLGSFEHFRKIKQDLV